MHDPEKDVSIDRHNLELEWQRQGDLYYHYSHAAVYAEERVKKIKKQLNRVRAKLEENIRANYSKYKLRSNPTIREVDNVIIRDKKYIAIERKLIKAETKQKDYEETAKSLLQKRYALQDLVRLHLANYYSEPHVDQREIKGLNKSTVKRKLKKRRLGNGKSKA